jgi:hypothetical protein
MTSHLPPIVFTVVSLASAIGLFACNGLGERVRERTYPPSFHYISTQELHSAMGQLAVHASRLDTLMRASEKGDQVSQAEVVGLLRAIERTAATLGPGDWPSNHPRVSRNIERFRVEVEAARQAAELDPPSYYRAGVVTGACSHCHRGT